MGEASAAEPASQPSNGNRPAPVTAAPPAPASRPPAPSSPLQPAIVRQDRSSIVGAPLRGGVGDIDGDGRPDLVLVDEAALRVITTSGTEIAETPSPGGIQVLEIVDLDGDGRAEILAGWGRSDAHRDRIARLSLYRITGGKLLEEQIAAIPTKRADVVAVIPESPTTLLFAFYDDQYMVQSQTASRAPGSAWTLKYDAEIRMANAWAFGDVDGDGRRDVVIGRAYGDTLDSDGDAFVLNQKDHRRTPIPTTRGVESLAIADSDGDGKNEIFLGDGWHRNYAEMAHGLLTWARWDGHAFRSEVIEDTAQPSIRKILAADLDGDGRPEIVTQGTSYVRVFKREGNTWHGLTVGRTVRDIAVGDLDGKPGNELLLIADRSELLSLRGARWP